ncbi:Achaete-scute 1a [Portunus trituberculatus]|uniref:Achaete-scute 1a n=1 Tax=Portunus trituberculatus TaxID=210409 RepID=A0A5B7EI42_PORTR|nr:Achaete-scute 1a [Portunus trituberculatus]
MQRSIKVEVRSPVKPEVLKPSNTPNILGTSKTSSMTSKAITSTLGKITSNAITRTTNSSKDSTGRVNQKLQTSSPKSVVISSSSLTAKSPLKPLLAIRPSPTPKVSIAASRLAHRSPQSLSTFVRTPSAGSSTLSTSAASPSSASASSISPVKCRRRINYSDSDAPVPVSRRNARERNRVKQLSTTKLCVGRSIVMLAQCCRLALFHLDGRGSNSSPAGIDRSASLHLATAAVRGFALLRQHVPQAARKKKMSKVETLRCAVDYIRGLQLLLDSDPPSQMPGPSPVSAVHSFHHHHHQQLQQQQTQVFLQPPHAIEPHILKLPVADETFQSPVSLRYASPNQGPFVFPVGLDIDLPSRSWGQYDSVTGTFFRTSPTDSEGSQSPAHSFLDKHPSPPNVTPSSSLGVGVIKTENIDGKSYGREEQDLLEALAWWQHNIHP